MSHRLDCILFLLLLLLQSCILLRSQYILGEPVAERLRDGDHNDPRPPILLIPGLVSTRLVAWKKKRCRGPDINIQDIVWLNLQKMVETMTFDPHCWIDCLKLNKNGTDPADCRVRPDEGLGAIGELSPGNLYTPPATSIFTQLIRMLAHDMGYDVNNILGAAYDWRLAPIELENRDSFFTTLKHRIETAVVRHKRPAIVMAHSMGNNIFLYFCDWLRYNDKADSMRWDKWLRKHIWAYVGYSAPLLGSPGALKSVLSGHTFGLTITEAQARELELTFSSTHLLNPRSSNYTDPIVTIKSSSGGSSVQFGINDVENGEIFRWTGHMFKEPLLLDKYETLRDLYTKDPLQPLKKLYSRPPIRHVIMVYGVDLETEVSYAYRVADATPGSSHPGPPILDEIFVERPCVRSSSTTVNSNSSSRHCSDSSHRKAHDTSTKDDANSVYIDDEMEVIYNVVDSDLNGIDSSIIGNDTTDPSANESNYSSMTDSPLNCTSVVPVVVSSIDTLVANLTGTIQIELSERSSKTPSRDCKTHVYSISQKKKNGMSSSKRTYIREGGQHHTGDITVPYLSLSYVHNWLEPSSGTSDRWEEYRPEVVHKSLQDGWVSPFKSVTIDPAVEIFYSKCRKTGDTTVVMEFDRVDHLDIAKHTYVNTLIFEYLLPKVTKELVLNETYIDQYDNSASDFYKNKNIHVVNKMYVSKVKDIIIQHFKAALKTIKNVLKHIIYNIW